MTIADCVILALKNNLDLKTSFLNRIPQRISLKLAEDQFRPKSGDLILNATRNSTYPSVEAGRMTGWSGVTSNYSATLQIPTGGTFAFNWTNSLSKTDVNTWTSYTPSWTLSFAQPLLKGAGKEVATANLVIARITEQGNILSLQDAITTTINNAITQYRSYVSALLTLKNDQSSLDIALKTYEMNKALVNAGRMAESELVQSEADIAQKRFQITNDKNAIDNTRLTLIQTLNLDSNLAFEPVEETGAEIKPPSFEEAIKIAKKYRTDYLKQLQAVETARLNFVVAKNGLLPTLNLTPQVGSSMNNYDYGAATRSIGSLGKRDWQVSAIMSIPIYEMNILSTYMTSKINYENAKIALKKLEKAIEIDVLNGVRDAESQYQALLIARKTTDLRQKQYDIENEKMRVGKTSLFQLISFQNNLDSAKQNELTALITYLNTLTTLDQKLGTTLQTWGINITKDDNEVRFEGKDVKAKTLLSPVSVK